MQYLFGLHNGNIKHLLSLHEKVEHFSGPNDPLAAKGFPGS
jgi:hypothetical protein